LKEWNNQTHHPLRRQWWKQSRENRFQVSLLLRKLKGTILVHENNNSIIPIESKTIYELKASQIDMFAYYEELCSPVEWLYRASHLNPAGVILKVFITGNEIT